MAQKEKKRKEELTEQGKEVEKVIKTPKKVSEKKTSTKKNSSDKKNTKTVTRKEAEEKNKKQVKKAQKESFFAGVKQEFKKIVWPSKKDMIKYSTAVIILILFFSLFFLLIDVIMAALKVVA